MYHERRMARQRTLTCALAGDAPLLLYCGEALLARGHAVQAVITDDAGVRRWAADHGLTLLTEEDDVAAFLKAGIDLLLDVGHHGGLAPTWVERARDAIRFHAGPLPRSAGHHPATWALLEGAQEHGVTWHIAGGRGHGGPIVAMDRFEIDPDETTGELLARCQEAGARTFDTLLQALETNRLTPRPQVGDRAWHGEQRSPPGAGILDWRRPAADLARQVRALCGASHSPVAWASMAIGADAVVVTRAHAVPSRVASAPPGTVLRHDAQALLVATGADALQIERVWHQDGLPLDLAALPVNLGEALPLPDTDALEALDQAWRPDMRLWARRLRDADPLPLPFGELGEPSPGGLLARPGVDDVATVLCAVVLLARAADRYQCDVGVTNAARLSAVAGLDAWFCPYVPLKVRLDPRGPLDAQLGDLRVAWQEAQRSGHRRDLAARMGHRLGAVVGGVLVARVTDVRRHVPPPEVQVACVFDGKAVRWWAPTAALGPLERGFAALVEAYRDAEIRATRPIAQLMLLSAPDRARLDAARLTMSQVSPLRVGDAVLGRAACAPDVAALTVGDRSMTCAQLEIATSRLARYMIERKVTRGCPLLVAVPDPLARVVSVLAAMIVGAVPGLVDPAVEPGLANTTAPDWLQGDARALVTTATLREAWDSDVALVICLDTDRAAIDAQSGETITSPARPDDPALRLPGEAGQRVVLTHRALVGVFSGVDEVIEHRDGVWLALSNAGSPATVIDTLWAISRGFEVILTQQPPARPAALSIAMSTPAGLRAVAQFADDAGMDGLWVIEEGLAAAQTPDAAVAAAAVLAWTRRLSVRAVTRLGMDLPRAFAVWRMVHALSAGRLEIGVAGESARRLPTVLANLAAVGADDAPVQPWAVAFEVARFVAAGQAGAGVLTVQTKGAYAELGVCISRYRQAWRAAGHPGRGQVVLLTPTLVGEHDATMRKISRGALARWLRRVAGAGPAVPLDALAICGDARRAAAWIADAARAGVDEIACLLDFGLPEGTWRPRVKHLADVRAALRADGPTLAELIEAHGVTHVSLPVSAARRLLTDDDALQALTEVRHVVLTGEPLSAELARATRDALRPTVRLTRRYAPAECGGWCATHPVLASRASDGVGPVPLGRPLAHARVEVVDARGQPVPIGAPGELCVGAVDVLPADSESSRQLVRADDVLMRVGLRVRQTPDGVLEPAPQTTIPPTAPPTPAPPRLVGERAAEQIIAEALWQTLGEPIGDVEAEVLGVLTQPNALVDVQTALSAALNRAVPMTILFTHRSVAALADWAEAPEVKDRAPRWRKPFRRGRRRK